MARTERMLSKAGWAVAASLVLLVLAACGSADPDIIRITATPRIVLVTATPSPTTTSDPETAYRTGTALAIEGTRHTNQTRVYALATASVLTPSPIPRPTNTATPLPELKPIDSDEADLPGIGTAYPQPAEMISPDNVENLVELARWGKGIIQDVSFSPDGKLLGVASTIGLFIYDAATFEEIQVYHFDRSVEAVGFSADGSLMAVGFENDYIQVMDDGGRIVQQLFDAGDWPETLRFVNDDRYLLITNYENESVLWELDMNQPLAPAAVFGDVPSAYYPSADGRYVGVRYGDTMRVWDWMIGGYIDEFFVENWVYGFAAGSNRYVLDRGFGDLEFVIGDGSPAWTANVTCVECLYQDTMEDHSPDCDYNGRDSGILISANLAFTPDRNFLVSYYFDQIQIRAANTGSVVRAFASETDFSFSPNGTLLAWGSPDGIVHIESTADWSAVETISGFSSQVHKIQFDPGGELVLIEYDEMFRLRSVLDGGSFRTISAEEIVFSPGGEQLALGFMDGKVEIRRKTDYSLIASFQDDPYPINLIGFDPTGSRFFAQHDCRVYVRNTETWAPVFEFGWNIQATMVFSPVEPFLIASSWENMEWLNSLSGEVIQSKEGSADFSNALFSPNGETLVMSGKVLDPLTLSVLAQIGKGGRNERYGFSPDGSLLFIMEEWEGLLTVVRTVDWTQIAKFSNSVGALTSIAVSSDGKLIAVGSYNGTVSIWGIAP